MTSIKEQVLENFTRFIDNDKSRKKLIYGHQDINVITIYKALYNIDIPPNITKNHIKYLSIQLSILNMLNTYSFLHISVYHMPEYDESITLDDNVVNMLNKVVVLLQYDEKLLIDV